MGTIMIRTILATLLLVSVAAQTEPYSQEKQFDGWQDLNGEGHNLRRKLLKQTVFPTQFLCPYTGRLYDNKTAQVNHIVPLNWAWQHGAEGWTPYLRNKFANDPDNLVLVYGPIGEAKGDRDPGDWLPPNHAYIPIYISRWKKVCGKYSLDCDYKLLNSVKSMYQP